MSWTRLDDGWTEQAALAELSYPDRWHYLAMIQYCSRTGRRDGILSGVNARRCSDVPEPAAALAALTEAGLIEIVAGAKDSYRVVAIDSHVPSDRVVEKTERDRLRKRRERAHAKGDHSLCEEGCPTDSPRTRPRTVGTGQDGTGRDDEGSERVTDWNVTPIGRGAV